MSSERSETSPYIAGRPVGSNVRRRACSSGRIRRAAFTFGPAIWQCISTPPGMTISPAASSVRAGFSADRPAAQ